MRVVSVALVMLLILGHTAFAAEEGEESDADPWLGCWARVYDATHLAKHSGQLVTAMTVVIDPRTAKGSEDPGDYGARVAANLRQERDLHGDKDQITLVPGVEIESFTVLSPDSPEHTLFLLHPIEAKACGE